jgi:hypothetical protein
MSIETPPQFSEALSREVPQTKWPKVVGIIGIVVGGVGGLGACCGVVGALATSWLSKLAEGQPVPPGGGPSPAEAMQAMAKHQGLIIALCVIALPIATMLIVGSVRLVRRRAGSPTLLLYWSAIKILETLGGTWAGFIMAKDQVQLAKKTAATPAAAEWAAKFATAQLVGGLVLGMALPIFLLIWLNRARIRDETAAWLRG